MGFFDEIMGALQKPQGVVVGGLTGLGNQISRATGVNVNKSGLQALGLQKDKDEEDEEEAIRIFRDLDERGVDTKAFDHLRPKAQTMMSGIKEGWEGKISPGELYRQSKPVETWDDDGNIMDKVLKSGFDIAVDPLMLAGGAIPKAVGALNKGGKVAQGVGRGLEGAGTVGNLANAGIEGGRGAMAASKAGQLARRGYQGFLASGDPMSAIGIGTMIGLGEKAITSPLAKAAASRLGRRTVAEGAETLFDNDSSGIGALTGRTQFGPRQGPTLPGNDSGQLFDDTGFVTSPASRQGAGAANPDLMRVVEGQEPIPFPGEMRALAPGTPSLGQPVAAGPVGSTGQVGSDPITAGILELLNKQQKALPRASATPLGPAGSTGTPIGKPKVTEAELLEFLRGEVQRLTGRPEVRTRR